MYLSAFLPMFWLILIKDYATILKDAIDGEVPYSDLLSVQLFIVLGIVLLITIITIILILGNKKLSNDLVVATKVTNRTAEYYLGYFSLFILELFAFSFTDIVDIVVMSILLLLLGIVYVKNGLFFINPTMNIFRSFIFEVEFSDGNNIRTKILICKEKIKQGDSLKIDISNYGFTLAQKVAEKENADE
jgi:hypothetical protein